MLVQINALQSSGGRAGGRGRRSRADEAELERLRRLLVEAIGATGAAEDDEAAKDLDESWAEDDDNEEDPDEGSETDGDWWPRKRWERYAPAKPLAVEGGQSTRSRRGAIGESWWSKRFLDAMENTTPGGRLTRGRTYARQGQVVDITVGPGLIAARVQGTRRTPYQVRISMPIADEEEWNRIVLALAGQSGFAARLLAGDIPHEVEDVFSAEGVSLLPSRTSRLATDCTCPDWANPCKHVAAVCYLVAEAFDRDPFTLLAWRGRDREAILDRLRELRGAVAAANSESLSASAHEVGAPPLAECLVGFWKAGPPLGEVRIRPEASVTPGAVLMHLSRGVIEVRGHDVAEVLGPAYADLAVAAEQRALGTDEPG